MVKRHNQLFFSFVLFFSNKFQRKKLKNEKKKFEENAKIHNELI